ncbi:MAG: hypothetical protein QOF97_3412 [Acidimicrobiaceae bacterium]
MRRRMRFAAVVLTVVGMGIAFGGPGAGADSSAVVITGQGWWSKLQNKSLPAPAPPPPNVMAGQLNVQGAPDGATAVAAFKATLGPNDTNPTLTLTVASDTGGDKGILLACRTGSAWTAGENGDMADAPHVDDKACVNAQRSADAKTYVVPLGTLQFGHQLDVVLVPGTDPALPAAKGSTFQLVFEKIAANSIATTTGTAPTIPTPHPLGSPASAAGGGSVAPSPASSSGGGGSFKSPSVPSGVSFTPTPALPQDKLGQTATSPVRNAATTPQVTIPAATETSDSTRLLGLLVLVAGVGLALFTWRDEAKARAAPLAAITTEDGGLGRFVRPRTGAPPALS